MPLANLAALGGLDGDRAPFPLLRPRAFREGVSRVHRIVAHGVRAGGRLEILAGGGVDDEAFALFVRTNCVCGIHVGRIARDGDDPAGPVSAAPVRRLRDLAG